MPTFKLNKNIISRISAKFDEFQETRICIHKLLHDYVEDYKNFHGSPEDRVEFLKEIYGPRAAKISHLLFDDNDKKIYWHVQDIAIIMGRDTTTIRRTFQAMEREKGWTYRIEELRKPSKSANNNNIYIYHEKIFDLILDHYEEEYLLRFSQPRHGKKINAPDMKEIRRFWDYLKLSKNNTNTINTNIKKIDIDIDEEEFSEIPPMSFNDVFIFIWRKIFTVKTGIIFSILFAFTFELARKFSVIMPYFLGISFVTFITCVIFLHIRVFRPDIISDIGAVNLLFVFTWGAAIMSDGIIYTPTGAALSIKNNAQKIYLEPEIWRYGKMNFRICSDSYGNIKKINYRISPDKEFHLTGFNDYNYPDLIIEPEQQHGIINLDVKFTNSDLKESDIFNFEFDLDKERFDLSKKKFLNPDTSWFSISNLAGISRVDFFTHSDFVDNVVDYIVYGINIDKPDTIFKIPEYSNETSFTIIKCSNTNIKYISSYLVFTDGTSSDIRRTESKKNYL